MPARYVWRLDDITPAMDWPKFERYLVLFRRHGVVPLLAVVPDNHDPALEQGPARGDFWDVMYQLEAAGDVELAQHGWRHVYDQHAAGLLTHALRLPRRSEFAGLPEAMQRERLERGKHTLESRGIRTSFFVAPGHSFDRATLRALAALGFTALSDGVGLYPYERAGITFVPQQLWRPRAAPAGIVTICLHSNGAMEADFDLTERFLRAGHAHLRFSAAALERPTLIRHAANFLAGAALRAAYARRRPSHS